MIKEDSKMAEDSKRNALFSKLFSKEKSEQKNTESREISDLDEIMAEEENYIPEGDIEATPANDEDYAAWFSEAAETDDGEAAEDYSDAIAELFGDESAEGGSEEPELSLDVPVLEDYSVEEARDAEYSPETDDNVAYTDNYTEDDTSDYQDYIPEEIAEEPVYEEEADALPEYADEYEDEVAPEEETEQYEAEEPAPAELDDDTATLLTALGYSASDAVTVSNTSVHKQTSKSKVTDLTLAFGYEGKEYNSASQTASIKNAYSRDHFKVLIRLVGTVLFTILLFVYDTFGKSFGGALDVNIYPVVNIMMSLQLLMITAAFSAKQLFHGINSIFKADPVVHSVSAAAVILTVIYDVVLAIASPEAFSLYNFPAAVCLLFSTLHDYFTIERELYVFDRLSSWQSVVTLQRIDTAELASELGENRVGEAEHKIGQAFRMRRAEFAENYFRHINRRNPMSKLLNFIIAPVIALSLVVFIISLASDKTAIEAFNAFLVVNLFSMPAFLLISMSYPFYTLVSKNLNADSVIFSESDVNEYKKVDTVVFDESDLFDETSLTINRISVCDKNRMQDVFDIMCGVSALYDRVGGRIAGAFRASTAEGDIPEDVSVIRVDDGGFEGYAGGRHYCVGSDAYLTARGIAVMRYYDDKYIASNPGGVVLHIAVDGAEVFKLYLTYRISDSILSVINELSLSHTRIVMRTVDPNINLELISRILTSTFEGKLTLVRKPYSEATQATVESEDTIDGGVIVNGENPESILDIVSACKRFGTFSKLNSNINLALLAIGVLLSLLLGVIGALAGISSNYIVLFQIFTAIPSIILANLLLK
jgi:hypothetical protein